MPSNFTCPEGFPIVFSADYLESLQEDANSTTSLWWIGLVLSIVTTFVNACGNVVVKMGYRNETNKNVAAEPYSKAPDFISIVNVTSDVDNNSTEKEQKKKTSKLLIIGNAFIGVVAPIIDVIALSFTAQSIVVPLGGLTIIWNFMLSVLVLKEKYNSHDILGNFSIVSGTALITIFGNHDSAMYPLPVLICLFKNELFVYYFGGFLMFVCILWITALHDMHGQRLAMVACCAIPGFFGGQHYFIKSTSELLRLAVFDHILYFDNVASYAISVMGILLAVAQLSLLNLAFSKYDSLAVVPIYSASLIFTGAFSGMAYFMEYADMDFNAYMTYSLGLFLILIGILLLSRRNIAATLDTVMKRSSQVNTAIQFDHEPIAPGILDSASA